MRRPVTSLMTPASQMGYVTHCAGARAMNPYYLIKYAYSSKCYLEQFAFLVFLKSELQMWLNEKNTSNVISNNT